VSAAFLRVVRGLQLILIVEAFGFGQRLQQILCGEGTSK
jgi:hypothetical protein